MGKVKHIKNLRHDKWFKKNYRRILNNINYFLDIVKSNKINMSNIEEIRNKYKGETIFLVGSGPSLDTYPDDFFKNRTSITLHLAYLKFPNTTYAHICEADRIQWLKVNKPDFFKTQGLFCNPFYPLVYPNSILKDCGNTLPYFLAYNPKRLHLKDIEKEVMAALTGKHIRYSSNGTCLHTGIWSALILGFKNINLIGCDHKSAEGKHYFSPTVSGDTRKRTPEFFKDAYYRMNVFTNEIIDVCRKYDIMVNRFLNYEDFQNKKNEKSYSC